MNPTQSAPSIKFEPVKKLDNDRKEVKVTYNNISYTATFSGELTDALKERIVELAGFLSQDEDVTSLTDKAGFLEAKGADGRIRDSYEKFVGMRIKSLEKKGSLAVDEQDKLKRLKAIYATLTKVKKVAERRFSGAAPVASTLEVRKPEVQEEIEKTEGKIKEFLVKNPEPRTKLQQAFDYLQTSFNELKEVEK